MRARVDNKTCQSSGHCIREAPEVFEWDDDHLARTRRAGPGLAPERLVAIARSCPAMAIVLMDDAGNEIDPFDVE